jgi:DNA-binding GntR family transcriptional regulator
VRARRGIVDAHAAILDGIETGDPEQAAEAKRAHLSDVISRAESIRSGHPDDFTDGVLR